MFVRVRVPTSPTFQGLLVSQEAIGTNQNLKYVDTLNDEDKVVRHDVTLGGLYDGLQVVTSGLTAKERVVISGMQRADPEQKPRPNWSRCPRRRRQPSRRQPPRRSRPSPRPNRASPKDLSMLARFFIDRPIFAWVLSLVIILVGGVAAFTLPMDMYPGLPRPPCR